MIYKNMEDQKKQIENDIIGLTYQETTDFFKNKKYYFRPIKIDNIILFKDEDIDNHRCNVIVVNNIIIKVDGWY